jgi:hypothetical protein
LTKSTSRAKHGSLNTKSLQRNAGKESEEAVTWLHALWFIGGGFMAGCGFMMWVQSARKYHEERTKDFEVE